ncbi:Transcriptional regulatory protein LiaR [Candidatus Promineifilum breve]|uniref:Transcriptional regulatory protein LiaR n=1 Tax=Candidatus Promineifilum breve TaxID=1806508 RepID=A0A160T493_9CHLR|nr:response regulator transcription factor [Candidatus Promineifilum breve]CUS04876.2 Transcriptional regulatory protein LiaR [Candidatus Promineifilum breve]
MNEPAPIRVLLVDDHTMVRRGLAMFLKVHDDLELAGEAATGEEAIQQCARVRPDVVLMDLVMPGLDGVEATRAIRREYPAVQVIALTSFNEEGLVQKVLRAGAIGYLLKDVSATQLAQAIRAAHAGRGTLSPEVAQTLIHASGQPVTVVGRDLTAREQAVLALMVRGMNNSEIAESLFVSPSTIKSHVSHILAKLGVAGRTEAVALAVRHHLVE